MHVILSTLLKLVWVLMGGRDSLFYFLLLSVATCPYAANFTSSKHVRLMGARFDTSEIHTWSDRTCTFYRYFRGVFFIIQNRKQNLDDLMQLFVTMMTRLSDCLAVCECLNHITNLYCKISYNKPILQNIIWLHCTYLVL